MSPLLALFLFLHVFGAIITFGPSFVFPLIAGQVRKSPQNGHFAAIVAEVIEMRIILPGAIVQGVTGVALILLLGANLFDAAWRWLLLGIVLYLIAIGFSLTVQRANVAKMVELTSHMPPGPPPAGAPAGPPPEIAATGQALARGGQLLGILLASIVFLMVVKPSIG